MGAQLAAPVALLHAAAFALGYVLCQMLGFDEKTARTVSIETGARQSRRLLCWRMPACVVMTLSLQHSRTSCRSSVSSTPSLLYYEQLVLSQLF